MRLCLAVLLLMFFGSAQAEEPRQERKGPKVGDRVKAAWEWTLDERIAKRLDAQEIRERAAAYERTLGRPQWMQVQGAGPMNYIIEGRRDPELFMPFELFVSILAGVTDPATPGIEPGTLESTRERYRHKITEFGWQEGFFWKTLEDAAADYLRYQTERLALQRQMRTLPPPQRRTLEARVEELTHKQCAARTEALRAMRAKLGPDAFDRFLYGAVAPGIAILSTEPEAADRLRFLEEGCQ